MTNFSKIEEIRFYLNRYKHPQLAAFKKGLSFELHFKNPYLETDIQLYTKRPTFRRSFKYAFEKGRMLKIKYKIHIQLNLF